MAEKLLTSPAHPAPMTWLPPSTPSSPPSAGAYPSGSPPDRPCSLVFADAGRLVADSWAFLSDPLRKASLDSDLDAAANAAAAAKAAAAAAAAAARSPTAPYPEKQQQQPHPLPPPQQASPPVPQPRQAASATPPSKRGRPPRAAKPQPPPERQQEADAPTFWTACSSCCHLHQYDRSYESRTLLCPSCRRPFFSAAMPTPPPIVPGTDMYYCSWGFFPLGFPGGPAMAGTINSPTQQAPAALGFYPMGPYLPLPGQGGVVEGNMAAGTGSGIAVSATATAAVPESPMPVKSTHVKVGARKRGRPKGSKNKNVVIEIN